MECLQNRIDSFNKPVRVQNASKTGAAKNIKWPHPSSFIAKPLTLAEAGFYFDPSYEERDNVTCFVCGKELAGWEEHDDPFEIHWKKCAKTCAWAIVRCALKGDLDASGRFAFTDKNRLPSSKLLEKARQQVYAVGDGWTHDQVRNHGASSKRMAKAGFLFTPQHPGDDSATCLYCNLSLNEWDSGDDPLEEHRKRRGTVCPFFIGSVPSSSSTLAASTSTKPTRSSSSSSLSKPPSSSRNSTAANRGRSRSVMPDIFEDTIEPLAPPAEVGPSKKSSNKKTSSSRSRSRKTITSIEEEHEEEHERGEKEEGELKKKLRASTKSVSRSTSRKRNASSSSRGKNLVSTVNEEEEQEEVEVSITAATTRSATTSTTKKGSVSPPPHSRKSTKPATVVEDVRLVVGTEDNTEEDEIERMTLNKSTLSKNSKKSSKSSSRSNKKKSTIVPSPPPEYYATAPEEAPEDDDSGEREEEEDPPVVLVPKKKPTSREITKIKMTKTRRDVPVTGEDNEDEEVEERQILGKSTTSKTKKSTTTSSKKSTTTARRKRPAISTIADNDDNNDDGGDEPGWQTLAKSSRKTKKKKSARTKKAAMLPTTEEEEVEEEEVEEEKPTPASLVMKKKSSKASTISAATSITPITTGSTDQDEEQVPTQQKKLKSKSHPNSAKAKSAVSKKERQTPRVLENTDEDEDEEMANEEPVVVTKIANKEKKALDIEDGRDEATVGKSKNGWKKRKDEVDINEDEEIRTPEVIISKMETKKKMVKGKKQIEEDEDTEMQMISATLKKPSLSVKPASKVSEEPLKYDSVGGDESTTTRSESSASDEAKGRSKQVDSTNSKIVMAEEQTSKSTNSLPSDGWPFQPATAASTATLVKWNEPAQQLPSDDSDSDVEMEDATIVRKMMRMKKSTSTERLQLPSPPSPTFPSLPSQPRSHPSHEREKPTNSEDEVQADLEDVDLDTEMDDHAVQQKEMPQEQHGGDADVDAEAISFAPRLVVKSSSEVEQPQRPRTPNLVPFQMATGSSSLAAGGVLPSVGGLGLGSGDIGREAGWDEKKAEEKIPKTPPRKFIFEGIVPPVPSANTKTSATVDKDHKINTDNTSPDTRSATPSTSGQLEDRHHQTPPSQKQELEKSKIPQSQFTPFLSKLPFVPLHVLSDAELDMTVEEWIRYQMEVEFDKFKRDGERELARFRKNAEETGKAIEGL